MEPTIEKLLNFIFNKFTKTLHLHLSMSPTVKDSIETVVMVCFLVCRTFS